MKSHLPVTIDMSLDDYEDLLDLLRVCLEESSRYSEFVDLSREFSFYIHLLKSNRR